MNFPFQIEPFAYSEFDAEFDGEEWHETLSANSSTRSIPRLMKSETQPPASTLYVEIDLKIVHRDGTRGTAPMTGIFIPENYKLTPTVDLILYLHGHKGANFSIDKYWRARQRDFYFPLREELKDSHKNVILVAPTLGPKSEAGLLTNLTEFNQYLDRVMTALKEHGPYKAQAQSPGVGKIILACHSGGGSPMRKLAKLKGSGGYADNVIECWGFDCLYNTGDDVAWANWAKAYPQVKLFIYYLSTTKRNSEKLKRKHLPNVFVERSSAGGHYWVPKAHWKQRLQQSGFLLNR